MNANQGSGVGGQGSGALKKVLRAFTAQWFTVALLAVAVFLPLLVNKFYLGLMIEVFVLAVFALSYNLLLGYIGIISFGHAMFFGSGAYVVGLTLVRIPWKSITQSLGLPPTGLFMDVVPLLVILVGVVLVTTLLGVLIGIVTLRVRGVYFAMVTLAFAEVLAILAASSELRSLTGGDEGLHDLAVPMWISPTQQRVLFYYLTLLFLIAMYLLIRRIVSSPTGRVLIAIRENEGRVASIGYNPFTFKLIGIVTSGIIAGLAGAIHALYLRNLTPETALGLGKTIDALLDDHHRRRGHALRPDRRRGRQPAAGQLPGRSAPLPPHLAAHPGHRLHPAGALLPLRHRRHLAVAAQRHPRGVAAVVAIVHTRGPG